MATERSLIGKVAIVSGSAKGIGAATCVELASRGALVIVNYPWPSEKSDAEDVLRRIEVTKGAAAAECRAVEADLSTLDGPQRLVDETVRLTGKHIDILINNAGVAIMRPLKEVDLRQWDTQLNLNARGMLLLTQAVLPHLAQDSRIVNVSSVGARQGYVGSSIYNGTKSMVESFTRCWALEFGRQYRCTVNAVEPGPTNTHGFNHSGPDFLEKIQPMLDATPMGSRLAEPSEIAHAIAFLCERRSGWITGACLPVDGGFFMP
ncbi:hypothetical protein LTR10_014527 [Elasticomyces elasticus]|uniref:Ketoreductase domain-containing protein n=1 Tax=Exophiala sideris TaxID=1016849 RepID=A0ABR0JSU7_9EURO|nr:hypothetical protein LTR10_014527 [Elasticomyces elasticus]KAK5040506.1 hypothetical protein LTS07_001004 [Exophiala sideris]KAK5043068.1 hypothetical protein LTR13_000839 [Exophiala sideris]KAK5068884.1 hypothetical protein LTR69_001005 [Exophiala sideris]KAK5186480.1 hypothetical protein LTR44_001536 [Eurotiomycetes sp. CCFEE 6388]